LEISQTAKDDVTIVHLSGEIWGRSGEPEEFKTTISQLVADGTIRVVVDLSKVRLISSIGIGMLIAAYRQLTEKGGMLALSQPSDPIKPVFRVLRGPFKDFDSEDDAIAFVREPRG
jgi:anti-sigma B factor antagonist